MYESIQDFMLTLIDLSKTGIFIILGVIMIRFLLRNAPKKYSYFLWIVVGIRLLCPFSIESILSIFNVEKVITPIVHNEGVVDQILTYAQPFYYENRINECIQSYYSGGHPIQGNLFFYFNIWMIGLVILSIFTFVSYFEIRDITKYAIRLKENIYQSDKVKAPFVFGFFNPKIYIPYHLDEQTQEIIINHESYHIKRKDHLFRYLALVICVIYWFNPFVWLAYHLFIEDMEMSCDEHVLLSKDNKTYSSTLLSFATNQFLKPKPLAFGESAISKRIKNSLYWKSPNKKTMLVSFVLCLFVLVSFTSDPTKQDNINSLLKRNGFHSMDQVNEYYYEYGYECEITSWSQIYRFNQWFDLVKLSKFEIEPSNSKIHTSYTIIDDNKQITFHFTEAYDECIVEMDDKKTAYKIVNSDIAESVLNQYCHDINYWPMWNSELDGMSCQNSYVRLIENYKNNEFEWKKSAFIQIDFSNSTDVYIVKCDYESIENQLTLTSLEDKNVFVFDIQTDGYDSLLSFNESKSKVDSKELNDILNKMTFTSDYDDMYKEYEVK